MTNNDFMEKILDVRIEKMLSLLESKGKEYGEELDRFSNFKEIGHIVNKPPEEIAFILMMKHFTFIQDFCLRRISKTKWTKGLIDEKMGDLINYLILIEGILKEGLKE